MTLIASLPQIASLPMYNWPELQGQTDQWWRAMAQAIRDEGGTDVPDALNGHGDPYQDWRSPDLFLSQTCGYPLRNGLQDFVQVVAVPRYNAPGCEGPYYSSMVVVRKEDRHLSVHDFFQRRVAYNDDCSQSGYSALRAVIAPLAGGNNFFTQSLATGSHLNSMATVADNGADICAIDCVSWALATRLFPDLVERLCAVGETPMAPALPYVTALSRSREEVDRIRRGLLHAVEDQTFADVRGHLLIDGFEFMPASAYLRIDEMEQAARDAGYGELR